MKYVKRIFTSIFKWAPFSAVFTIINYISAALIPAAITVISVGLFDSAARALNGEPVKSTLYLYAALYLGFYLVNDILNYISSITINAGIYEKGTAFFRIALYEKLAKMPLISFEDAEILNRKERAERAVNDETLSSIFNRSLIFLRSIVTLISVAAVLAKYSLWLIPLSVISVLPYLFARLVRGKEFVAVKNKQAKKTRLLGYLWGLFTTRQTAKEMRVMGFDGYITEKWRATRDEVNEELWAVQKKDAISLLRCDGIRIVGYCVSIIIVLLLVIWGQVSLGVFGASVTAFLSLQNGMKEFLIDLGRIPEQLAYAKDYYTFIDMPEEAEGKNEFTGLRHSITFNNVCFSYPNSETQALKSLNITINKGEKIALLGVNGSGKTTFSKLLLGLYSPAEGNVLYDGKNIAEFSKDSLYSKVSAIAQDFVSYSLTLRENVAISDVSRLDDDMGIKSVLASAGGGQNIDLDGMMGREFGGRELSGGQWQKLAIARGLFKDSELIVLDEPTSALDPLIETEILSNFIKAAEGKTALIISHRVGLCRLVNRIIVMKDGEIAESGTHGALVAAGGEYAALYREQAKWYS
jgi:ATP-binding cassette subfamily B protein